MRRTHQNFAYAYCAAIAHGLEERPARLKAYDSAFPKSSTYNEAAKLTRSDALLKEPNVLQAIRNFFGDQGFTVEDAAEKIIAHIKGEIEYEETQLVDGIPVTFTRKIKPDAQMLKWLSEKMLPSPVKQVQVQQQTLVAKVLVKDEPEMRVRRLDK